MTPTFEMHKGDALAVLRDMPSGSVDAVITDPPYSSGGQYRGDRTGSTAQKYGGAAFADFDGDNRDQRSYLAWMGIWLAESMRVTAPGGVVAVFTDWRQLPVTTDAVQVAGWVWRGVVPWVKHSARPAYQQRAFLNVCEYVVWGSRGAPRRYGGTRPLPGFYKAAAPRDREHQTQKPLDVMLGLVDICAPGGTVLDPFAGSGTTGVAAIQSGRNFVGVEMTDHYHAVAERRLREAAQGYKDDGEQMVLGGAA